MRAVVTGGAGFIGSNLVDALIARGDDVVVIDDFSSGHERFLDGTTALVRRADLLDPAVDLDALLEGADCVYHLAANADVRFGWSDTSRDLRLNVHATLRLAEAADRRGVPDFVFSSTGAVYGEATVHPTPEDAPFPIQTSLYGASKTAAEGFLAAFAAREAFRVTVHRFVSVLGPRYMHGHVIDFVRQLTRDPSHLTVLGNGTQRKSYMHVDDCVRGLIDLRPASAFEVFNLGVADYCRVSDSVQWICGFMGLDPEVTFGTEDRGWIGDNPFTFLDTVKANERGWIPEWGIKDAVGDTVRWLTENPWALEQVDRRQ